MWQWTHSKRVRSDICGNKREHGRKHLVSYDQVSKSNFQCVPGSTYRRGCIRNQGAKTEYAHMPGAEG